MTEEEEKNKKFKNCLLLPSAHSIWKSQPKPGLTNPVNVATLFISMLPVAADVFGSYNYILTTATTVEYISFLKILILLYILWGNRILVRQRIRETTTWFWYWPAIWWYRDNRWKSPDLCWADCRRCRSRASWYICIYSIAVLYSSVCIYNMIIKLRFLYLGCRLVVLCYYRDRDCEKIWWRCKQVPAIQTVQPRLIRCLMAV